MSEVIAMGKDIKALELLQNKYAAFRNLPDPPEDTDKIEIFQGKWSEELDGALSLFDDIAAYINAINDQMELIRTFLNQSTKDVQQRILDIVDSIKLTDKQPTNASIRLIVTLQNLEQKKNQLEESADSLSNGRIHDLSGTYKRPAVSPSKSLKQIQSLQKKVEQKKNRLEESILKTQEMLNKIDTLGIITQEDMDALRGCINQWINVRDESYEAEKRRKEAEEKSRKDRQDEERRRKEERERRRQEDEERRKAAEEKARKEREELERRRKQEEDRRRQEEEENRRKEAEDKARKEREEREELERRRRQEKTGKDKRKRKTEEKKLKIKLERNAKKGKG